ncbi:S-adenosyl-l-methionine hydroxide adenosyltransferase family protein [Aerosakkonemataceae cyanobacterium BLCC-F154]|uniref:S-adenosyl-l-methionine hydroxide adenosyltransferase family protein n=1 Tax=Floridaenema fluviatile BLCC-F154 TaxID=3153640 RepID=A0ABV4YCT6_9CYAN
MKQQKIVTLLTDFGLSDVYVGVMKGVIADINPTLKVIDLTHEIPPQNLIAARFCLMNAVPYFSQETVHIAVVDPGVGSNRRGVAIKFEGGFLVGPDNGLFSGIIGQIAAVELTNSRYWRTDSPSTTFHGRDIFAAVGAHLASGVDLEELGIVINPESLIKLPVVECREKEGIVEGCIQYIDRFGNLITNIPGNLVINKTWTVEIAGRNIPSKITYSDIPIGSLIALIGSHGWVEIAVNNGNAQSKLQLNYGDPVKVLLN